MNAFHLLFVSLPNDADLLGENAFLEDTRMEEGWREGSEIDSCMAAEEEEEKEDVDGRGWGGWREGGERSGWRRMV